MRGNSKLYFSPHPRGPELTYIIGQGNMLDKSESSAHDYIPSSEMELVALLGGLRGLAEFSRHCHAFYTEKQLERGLPPQWTPWSNPGNGINYIQWLMPHLTDVKIISVCKSLAIQSANLDKVNDQGARALASFFEMPAPTTNTEFQSLRKKMDRHRRKNGVDWVTLNDFQLLISAIQQIATEMQRYWLELDAYLDLRYPNSRITRQDMGDQRAKDLIDVAVEEPDPLQAIKLLNRALRYGHTGIQASKAYQGLGSRYKQIGDTPQAIENYTKSLDAWRGRNPFTLFWRGELYYQQERWEEARTDFERALTSDHFGSPEYEAAQNYLVRIESKTTR